MTSCTDATARHLVRFDSLPTTIHPRRKARVKLGPRSAVSSAMTLRSRILILWLVLGTLAAVIVLPLSGPLCVAWQCYWLHENGVREQAEVMHKLENATLALHIADGPHAGQGCTADTSLAIFSATQIGDVLEVVYLDSKPGECELSSTIEASAKLLWFISGAVGLMLAGLLVLGIVLTRSFAQPVQPARRMAVDPQKVRCPACDEAMDEGYLPILAGIHWRKPDEPIGLPHALRGLPGTVSWRARPRLHAFRCLPCQIVTFQYGEQGDPSKPPRR